ncbi:MAG: 3-phosphoshikimate 1-carboxyvinyltransferase [Candidatus Magasanikbacteria bacterium CG_4_10_14_0_2_um_filter_37_12]|uniref:3-phosphoshikimate 1-carboxyvinyltransferase n=1 Tax=Candidatus Magasanikbacteria bacterium CG_4_10_14_0_2_um_filter_37_12 TaxID=1974637 RepID=A0A2M7V6T8_9BACT|nr:MAG: 3-phosphoshikimate 1-carboxyvinyltransferase [Candidatus Magasanikbacteria bacterium CG_4_10_14_0_2_um_filter_37_12]
MKLVVQTTRELHGNIIPPSSKSETIRAFVLTMLAGGRSVLHNVLESDDTHSAIEVCRGLGAIITREEDTYIVESTGVPLDNAQKNINSGNSGITTRFILPALGLRKNVDEKIILDCAEQMRQRPVESIVKALNGLGMRIESVNNDARLPLRVSGKLIGGSVEVDGTTSQYLSALLLSAPYAEKDIEITVSNLQERPYVDMTLALLSEQGIVYEHKREDDVDTYIITLGQKYQPFEKVIPIDFSSASYPITASCIIPGHVTIEGVDLDSTQGDRRLIAILQEMGAVITIGNNKLIIHGGKPLHGTRIDANDIPDMLPTLAIIGAYAEGETIIENVAHARIKETDRIKSMTEGLKKMGADVEELLDGMIVKKSMLHGAEVHGYDDHRTIMALGLAGMLATGETVIDTAEGINKTFPNYVELMQSLGAGINVTS